jgi:lipopolysaccharide/colanic/teichoic acid biosynthesis glycosyltransferase
MSLIYQTELANPLEVGTGDDAAPVIAPGYLSSKAIADRIVAAALLGLTLPLILVLIVLVKLTSRGPAIYSQLRLGRDGRPYHIYKLRTMRHDCERQTGAQWAAKSGDPRVTSFGLFLRRSHLDELPQLWNVIMGDMSLVGPRPERPEFVSKLERVIPNYRDRMAVRPGITGLAQVQLPADEDTDDVRRKVRCDLCYIRHMGPLLDLKILMGTVLKVAGVSFGVTTRVLDLPGVESNVGEEAAEMALSRLG